LDPVLIRKVGMLLNGLRPIKGNSKREDLPSWPCQGQGVVGPIAFPMIYV
jgi:hypothetical protein